MHRNLHDMTVKELQAWMDSNPMFLGEIGEDNDGQILIYTGVYQDGSNLGCCCAIGSCGNTCDDCEWCAASIEPVGNV